MGQKWHTMRWIDRNHMSNGQRRYGRWSAALLAAGLLIVTGPAAYAQTAPDSGRGVTKPKQSIGEKKPDAKKGSVELVGPQAAPTIKFDKPSHDFGEVWSGTKVEHTWLVRNDGSAILKITKVKPSCGCTVAKNYDREILPGQTGKIPISINTARLRSKVTKTVTVSSNDPQSPTMRLTVSGTVKQRIKIDPAKGGTFGRIKPNETVKRTLTLTNNTESPIELSLVAAKANVFTAELLEKEPGQVYELKLRTNAPYQEKYNRGKIQVRTNITEQPILDIPVSVYILPQVEVTPTNVIIPKAQRRPRKQPVRVTFNTEESYKVLSAEVDNPDVKVDVQEARSNSYTITLSFPANYFPPPAGHKLTIKTDHPDKKEITVKIASRRTPTKRPNPLMQLVGKPAPAATFTTPEGKSINTKDTDEVSFYMFYTSWCGYCKKALPKINEMAKEYEGKGVRFVAISQDTLVEEGAASNNRRARTKDQVVQQWKDLGMSFTQAFDPDKAGSSLFKVRGFPTLFLVGKGGKVERAFSGIGAITDGSLKKDIADLVAGKKLKPQPQVITQVAKRKRPAELLKGKPAPAATFVTTAGDSFSSTETGQVSLLKFYASWCGYCKRALPKVDALAKEYKDKPVRFVAVSLDSLVEHGADPKHRRTKTKEYVIQQFKDLGLSLTQAFDPENAGKGKFKVSSFPTLFLIDQAGKIDKVYVGGGAVNDGSLKKDIDALLAGKKDRADAGGDAKAAAKLAATSAKK